jgi:hypothetical protein
VAVAIVRVCEVLPLLTYFSASTHAFASELVTDRPVSRYFVWGGSRGEPGDASAVR